MFKNYLIIGFRNIIKKKLYALLNITGLAIGFASCLIIYIYLQHELSYDNFHDNADRIIKVNMELKMGEQKTVGVAPAILAKEFLEDFPEVESGVLVHNPTLFTFKTVRHEDKIFQENSFYYADSTFFKIFSFRLISGNPESALSGPNKIVITENMAKKYFGGVDPLGKFLTVDKNETYEVTGVLANLPSNSVFQFDFLASIASQNVPETWDSANYFVFFLLRSESHIPLLQQKMPDYIDRRASEDFKSILVSLKLIPLKDLHLYSNADFEIAETGNPDYIILFGAIGIFILLIASINYMNMATAKSIDRSKEIGLRKSLGAGKHQLFLQFISESLILSFFSLLLAIGLTELTIPFVEEIVNADLSFNYFNITNLLSLIIITFLIGMISGSYPSLFLSSQNPVNALKGKFFDVKSSRNHIRKSLVTLQFAISLFLITATAIVYNQLYYLQNKNLGFDKDQVVLLNLNPVKEVIDKLPSLKNELNSHHEILSTAYSSAIPGHNSGGQYLQFEGMEENEKLLIWEWMVCADFIKTLNLKVIAGKDFDQQYSLENEERHFILNETAVRQLNMEPESLPGRKINISNKKGICVGVIQDFHMASFKENIEPLVLCFSNSFPRYFLIKAESQNMIQLINNAENAWKKTMPDYPFEYTFLDQDFARLFTYEIRTSKIMTAFTIIALLIACLGLFGLISFSINKRAREIGIRKVFGSSELKIVYLLTKETFVLILFALLIAAPVTYWVMAKWLTNFVYRIQIHPAIFMISFLILALIAFLTLSYQAVQAAKSNPVEVLKYE